MVKEIPAWLRPRGSAALQGQVEAVVPTPAVATSVVTPPVTPPPQVVPQGPHSDLEGLDLATLDRMLNELIGSVNDFDELSIAQLERYCAISGRMRTTNRTASKPGANGTGRTTKRGVKATGPVRSLAEMLAMPTQIKPGG